MSVVDAPISELETTAKPAGDLTARQIIARARSVKSRQRPRAPMRGALLLSIATGALFWASYHPVAWSPLAWLAPVPLFLLVRLREPTARMYRACYLGGLCFFVPALQWMRYGDPTMYIAWIALAVYLAGYFPLQVAVMRAAVHRLSVPLVVAGPVAWVAGEYLRAHLMTGFAWYFLGHTQYRWLEMIQISDITGAYGVSFVMALTAAALASLVPDSWFGRLRLLPPADSVAEAADSPLDEPRRAAADEAMPAVLPARCWPVVLACVMFVATLTYGFVRREQADFRPGPRVGLVQGNFLASLRIPRDDYHRQFMTHMKLTALAVREQPDVIIWPESMFRWPLTSAPAGLSEDELQSLAPQAPPNFWRDLSVRETLIKEAQKTRAAMIYGIECVDLERSGHIRQANSAVIVRPESGISGRYDKQHLVPFGEYLPLKDTLPWLQKLTPYPPEFGLDPGDKGVVFTHGEWKLLPVICFEDTVPQLVRGMVAGARREDGTKGVDVVVNLSNDGWFHGSSGLDQHLITAAFRAVECRTPMVRAVNTGVSAFIDGDGAILEPEAYLDGEKPGRLSMRDPETGRWRKQLNAALVSTVPLDSRNSAYVRCGDWFALSCLGLTAFAGLNGLRPRPRLRA